MGWIANIEFSECKSKWLIATLSNTETGVRWNTSALNFELARRSDTSEEVSKYRSLSQYNLVRKAGLHIRPALKDGFPECFSPQFSAKPVTLKCVPS